MTCAVPGCDSGVFSWGVCMSHRLEETTPLPHELDRERMRIRIEVEETERRQREAYSAPLRLTDDGWDGHTTRYGRKAFERILNEDVMEAEQGRNNSLFKGAARIYGLVASGHVTESLAHNGLRIAGRSLGLPEDEIRACLASAERAGKKKPWGPTNG